MAAALLAVPGFASADFTATVNGNTATFTGDSESNTLQISISGTFLQQNRFAAGDPGFASASDFNSSVAGDQRLAIGPGNSATLSVNGGAGSDTLAIDETGRDTSPIGTFTAHSVNTVGAGANGGPITYTYPSGIESLEFTAPGSFSINGTSASTPLQLNTEASHVGVVQIGGGLTGPQDLNKIKSAVSVDSVGNDSLDVSDAEATQGHFYSATTGQITRNAAPVVSYIHTGGDPFTVNLTTGRASDSVTAATPIDSITTGGGNDDVGLIPGCLFCSVKLGPGNDVVGITSDPNSILSVDGQGGSDTLKLVTQTDPMNLNLTTGLLNSITSVAGIERALGGHGADKMVAGPKGSTLDGGGGGDHLTGKDGPDRLLGGDGDDRLVGGKGKDHLSGGDGVDQLESRDGAPDRDKCGGGSPDVALVDAKDFVASDCEAIGH
jgi:Ca2+-binding RTX toxin-like protein